ncbi:Ger(x)C family spore germination protein [Pseudalkalibacillus hwajinpoensis]|uniref:Ger(x)C family spore germination protein n=1 Tax=Guptibacillus hwajinpoensis TaxID=208199 RepID=UPI00146C8A9F|nr:Ger(x)C family spore germination protein [Pseudalkalibacillus hwajinpoensis]
MRNLKLLVIVFSLIFLLLGCNDQKIIENLGFMSVMCFDKASDSDEEKMLVTSTFPSFSDESTSTEIKLDTVAYSKKEAEKQLSAKTEQQIVNGQIRSLIFGEEFASDGINRIIQSVERDREIGSQVKVVVAEGEASAILESIPIESTGNYVDKMLKKDTDKFTIPYADIHHFSRDLLDDGIDPVVPLIGVEGKDVVVKGSALFRGDQYVGNLTIPESKILLLLIGKVKSSDLVVKIPQESGYRNFFFSYNHSKPKVNVKKNGAGIKEIRIHVTMEGALLEDTGSHIKGDSPTNYKEVEKLIDRHLTNEAAKLIEILKEKQADSLGVSRIVRNSVSYGQWKSMKEEDLLEKVPVNISFNVVVRDNGMLQ